MSKNLEEFGIHVSIIKNSGSPPYNRNSVITVVCPCGAEAELKISSILRTMKRVGHYRCLSCGMKAKHQDAAYKEKHRDGIVQSWSPERRERQSEISKSMWSDDDFRQHLTNASKEAWDDQAKRQQASATITKLWEDSEFRAKYERAIDDPNVKQARMDAARKMWQNPEYVERQRTVKASAEHVELQRQLALKRFEDPEYRQHISESIKEFWANNSELRKEISSKVSALWKNPEYLDKQARAAADPALCALKSENAKLQWNNPSVRKAIVDGIKKAWENPDYRARVSALSKQRWNDDTFREKQAVSRANMLANGKDSILERTTQTLLDTLKIPYVRHHVVGYFEFDLLIPTHNILIECNGEYWHSLRKNRDAAKFSYIDNYFPEYRVLYLWERDFLNPNLIRHKLINALFENDDNGTDHQTDFLFDDLSIRQMDMSVVVDKSYYSHAEEFLQSFHYAGFGRSAKVVYGVFLEDTLIGVCKFCSPMRNESATSMGLFAKQVLELDRFCIHPNYQKKNLASWFISRCTRQVFMTFPDVNSLISFSDSTFGHIGTIYKAANWKQVHTVPADYHYISPDGFVIHKKTLYDHAKRNGLKEAEYALKFGYVKAFGKSKTKFRLDRNIKQP